MVSQGPEHFEKRPGRVYKTCRSCGAPMWLRPAIVSKYSHCSRVCKRATYRGARAIRHAEIAATPIPPQPNAAITLNHTLSAEKARRLLSYDPATGDLTRLVTRGSARRGTVAGDRTPRGHVTVSIDGHGYRAHRLAWLIVTGEWPEHEIDHINGDRADNRWTNLRSANHAQNQQNKRLDKNNKSGVRGAVWDQANRAYRVTIWSFGKQYNLGYYPNLQEAAAVRLAAELELHGEFSPHFTKTASLDVREDG